MDELLGRVGVDKRARIVLDPKSRDIAPHPVETLRRVLAIEKERRLVVTRSR